MAKVIYGPNVAVVSGKVAGSVYSRNNAGAYIRTHVIPTKVVSTATNFVRGIMTTLSQAYGALTAAQQTAWATWAGTHPVVDRIGQSITLQASAAFIKLNHRILQLGSAQIANPPIDNPPAGVTGQAVVASEVGASCSVSWTSGLAGANNHVVVWIAMLDSAGRNYYRDKIKLVYYGAADSATPLDVAAEVVTRFGTILAGQKIKCELEVWDDQTGLVSGKVFCEAIVGA